MLDTCAKGHDIRGTLHRQRVIYNEDTHWLPRGDTGESDPKILLYKLRKIVRSMGLETECVNGHFPGLMALGKEDPDDQPEPVPA